jgi:hypothetical protein
MKRNEQDITLMYGAFVKPEYGNLPHVRKRRKLITVLLTLLAIVGLWMAYAQPWASDAALPNLIKRDVHLGATETGIMTYLKFRHMDFEALDGDALSQAIEDGNGKAAAKSPDLVGDIVDPLAISNVVHGATHSQTTSGPTVSGYFYFDKQNKLVAYYIVQPKSAGNGAR